MITMWEVGYQQLPASKSGPSTWILLTISHIVPILFLERTCRNSKNACSIGMMVPLPAPTGPLAKNFSSSAAAVVVADRGSTCENSCIIDQGR
jgi:hypothetical protein